VLLPAAVAGQLDLARAAQEQHAADLLLQRLDLAADGRLREAQLVGRGAEREQPRNGLEGAQRADGQRALAEQGSVGHGVGGVRGGAPH
jgi:hypothetical protein